MRCEFLPLLLVWTLAACYAPVDAPPPPTSIFVDSSPQAVSTVTSTPAIPLPASLGDIPAYLTAIPSNFNPDFCKDTRTLQVLRDLQTAIQTRDGELLASLISPASGMGVRFLRDGNVITYFDNVKFIFETTYDAKWGLGPGSGEPVTGSFQEIVLPSLDLLFASNPLMTCNQLQTGGVTYVPEWPYTGMEYYSLYFPGTSEYSGMDWQTWVVGMVREEGKPMLAALVHFAWEP